MSGVGAPGKEAVEGDKEGVGVETPESSLDEAVMEREGHGNGFGFSEHEGRGVVTRKPPEEGNEGEGSEGEEGGPNPPSNVFFFVLSFVLSPILSFVLSLFPLFFFSFLSFSFSFVLPLFPLFLFSFLFPLFLFSFLVLLLFPLFRWLLGVGGRGALLGSAMPV